MHHLVTVVEDNQLPTASPWVIVRHGDVSRLFVSRTTSQDPDKLRELITTLQNAPSAPGLREIA